MNAKNRSRIAECVPAVLKIALGVVYILPFYVCIAYAFKTRLEIVQTGLSFPKVFHIDNFIEGVEVSGFWLALKNSVLTTIPTALGILIVTALASYMIERTRFRSIKAVYYVFLAALLLPFQAIMLPLTVNMKHLGMMNSLSGFIIAKVAVEIPFSVITMSGFIKTVPREIEEAAAVDGSSRFVAFWVVVMPMLKPICATVFVLNALYAWNEFQMALILLQKQALRTIPLLSFYFFAENATELNLAFAVLLLSLIPIIALYIFLQKYIISGITAGSLKG